MEKLKKTCKLEHLFMAYNVGIVVYLFAAFFVWYLSSGNYAILVFTGSAFVAALAGYRCWKQKTKPTLLHWFMFAFFGWYLVSAFHAYDAYWTDNLRNTIYLFCFIVPASLIFLSFTKEQCVTQWKAIAIAYNAIVTFFCGLGIYSTLSGETLTFSFLSENRYIASSELKLYLFMHHNNSAQMIILAILLALFMVLCAKPLWMRVLFAIDFVIAYTTLSLTYSRTGLIALSACLGLLLAYFIWHAKAFHKIVAPAKNVTIRLASCAIVIVAVIAASYTLMTTINTNFYLLSVQHTAQTTTQAEQQTASFSENTSTALLQLHTDTNATGNAVTQAYQASTATTSSAQMISDTSEEAAIPEYYLEERSLENLGNIDSRLTFWIALFESFIQDGEALLFGYSPSGVAGEFSALFEGQGYIPMHAHNMYLQVLTATGIPGFCLCMAFFGIAIFTSVKAYFTNKHFAEGCWAVLLLAAFAIIGLQEALITTGSNTFLLPAFFMGCATTASLTQKEK